MSSFHLQGFVCFLREVGKSYFLQTFTLHKKVKTLGCIQEVPNKFLFQWCRLQKQFETSQKIDRSNYYNENRRVVYEFLERWKSGISPDYDIKVSCNHLWAKDFSVKAPKFKKTWKYYFKHIFFLTRKQILTMSKLLVINLKC